MKSATEVLRKKASEIQGIIEVAKMKPDKARHAVETGPGARHSHSSHSDSSCCFPFTQCGWNGVQCSTDRPHFLPQPS